MVPFLSRQRPFFGAEMPLKTPYRTWARARTDLLGASVILPSERSSDAQASPHRQGDQTSVIDMYIESLIELRDLYQVSEALEDPAAELLRKAAAP